MRVFLSVLMLTCASAGIAGAQSKPFELNTKSPEGITLTVANNEDDPAKKAALFDEFIRANPKHEGVVYAGPIVQDFDLKAGQLDRVIELASLVLAIDPATPVAAYNALQACEQKKDYAGIMTWVQRTVAAANVVLKTPKPDASNQLDFWTQQQDYAKQVITRCEYSLFSSVLQTADPKLKVSMGEALIALNPNSQYMAQLTPHYIFGLLQTGRAADAVALAEKTVEADKTNDDMALLVADSDLNAKKFDKAASYAGLAIAALQGKTAPAGVDAAAWDKAKTAKLAHAYFDAGNAAYEMKKYADADKSLRAALPLAQGNNEMLGAIYFYLGFANHEMAKAAKLPASKPIMAEARKFTTACAAITGPYQETCQKNLAAMQAGK
jgi:tetratricopeptide (TPR) repeat protein